MSTPQPTQTPTVLDKFGQAVGVLMALILTLPINEILHPVFARYALSYTNYQHQQFLWLYDLLFLGCVFFFIFVLVWFLIVMGFKFFTKGIISIFKGSVFILVFIFSLIFRR